MNIQKSSAVEGEAIKIKQLECSNCYFFRELEEEPDFGTCQRYAPRPANDNKSETDFVICWPFVGNDDWCGEWKSK